MVQNPPAKAGVQETPLPSLGGEDPLEKEWQPTPVLSPGESHGQRSLAGYGSEGCKESDTTEATQHACMNLVALRHVGSSQARNQTHVSCRVKWVLYH